MHLEALHLIYDLSMRCIPSKFGTSNGCESPKTAGNLIKQQRFLKLERRGIWSFPSSWECVHSQHLTSESNLCLLLAHTGIDHLGGKGNVCEALVNASAPAFVKIVWRWRPAKTLPVLVHSDGCVYLIALVLLVVVLYTRRMKKSESNSMILLFCLLPSSLYLQFSRQVNSERNQALFQFPRLYPVKEVKTYQP